MDKPKIIFILNPIAGGGKKVDKNLIVNRFPERDVVFLEDYETRDVIIKDLIKDGVKDFVVIGGDGTVNDVAKVIMGTPANMGIIPKGSGNGLARDLSIPIDFEKALDKVVEGRVKKIDVGVLNGRPFFCTAGIGFDAVCAYEFAHQKHNRGLKNYMKIILENYYDFHAVKVTEDGEEKEYFSITFANAAQYGNNAFIAPYASLSDGFLDCSKILPHPKTSGVFLGISLISNTIDRYKYYESKKIRSYRLENISDKRIHIDGESVILEEDFIEVKVLDNILNVIA